MHWLRRIFPEVAQAQLEAAAVAKLEALEVLAAHLRAADCVIMTLGTVVDFFRDDVAASAPLMDKTLPKFVAMTIEGDLGPNPNAALRLKKQGATLRLATHAETREAIAGCIEGIRSITAAPIVITLSPVPVDSVIGLAGGLKSGIEVDCVSKSAAALGPRRGPAGPAGRPGPDPLLPLVRDRPVDRAHAEHAGLRPGRRRGAPRPRRRS